MAAVPVAIISRCAVVRRDSPRMISDISSTVCHMAFGIKAVQHRRAHRLASRSCVAVAIDLFTRALLADFSIDLFEFALGLASGIILIHGMCVFLAA